MDITGRYQMPSRAIETAKVLQFFDQLFDSLNGGTFTGTAGKPLTGAVRVNSRHASFWKESIISLKQMFFRKEGTQEKIIPPSLRNLILTLEGFLDLSEILLSEHVPYFFARAFNQDCLENYFGQVRQHRGRHVNPTCQQFQESYKALLIRNITGVHSVAANCEETYDTSLLQLKDLLQSKHITEGGSVPIADNPLMDRMIAENNDNLKGRLQKAVMGYISGFIVKKVLKKFTCEFCRIHMIRQSDTSSEYSALIQHKEFDSTRRLIYCNDIFIDSVCKVYNIAKLIVSKFQNNSNIKQIIYQYVNRHVSFTFVCAHKDEIIQYIVRFIVKLCLVRFCKLINDIMLGKYSTVPTTSCNLFKKAFEIHEKRRKYMK